MNGEEVVRGIRNVAFKDEVAAEEAFAAAATPVREAVEQGRILTTPGAGLVLDRAGSEQYTPEERGFLQGIVNNADVMQNLGSVLHEVYVDNHGRVLSQEQQASGERRLELRTGEMHSGWSLRAEDAGETDREWQTTIMIKDILLYRKSFRFWKIFVLLGYFACAD